MKTFNYTTHSKQVLGDMHTPVSIYLKVRDMYPQFTPIFANGQRAINDREFSPA